MITRSWAWCFLKMSSPGRLTLHNPDRVLHMLRNQSALEVKEQHKAALWGFVQQALATFCENPENLHQPAVRKVLGIIC